MTDDIYSLAGRTALVTGGGSGLGRAMALALAKRGADIAIADVDASLAQGAAEEIRSLGVRAIALRSDVTARGDAQTAVEAVVAELSVLDILLNNAGVAIPGSAASLPLADMRRMYEVNVFGLFSFAQAAYAAMAPRRRGVIINIASTAGITVLRQQQHSAYSSTKAAVVMLTRSMAVEWAADGIRVNAIAPGFMLTAPSAKIRDEDPSQWATWMTGVPFGRPGLPSELDGAVVYLASDASSYVTGSVVVVDGGYTCW